MTSALGVAALVVTAGGLWSCWCALRRRPRPGAVSFALFSLAVSLGTGHVAAAEFLQPTVPFLYTLVFATLLWTGFVLDYTGRGPAVTTRRLAALVAVGGVVSAVQWLLVVRLDVGAPYTTVVSLSNLGVVSVGAFGVFSVVRAGVTYDDLPRGRALVLTALGTTLVCLWFVGTLFSEQLDAEFARVLLFGLLTVVVTLSVLVQSRYDLLGASPSAGYLARDRLFDEMTEAVLVANDRGRLIDTNRTAETALGLDADTALGTPVEDAVGRSLSDADGTVVSLDTRDGQREFRVRASPLGTATDPEGTVYLLRDVTDRRTREQQLQVLNRVLRHNLRNDLDSVRAFAEPVREGGVDAAEAAALGDRMTTGARRVLSVGETVARADHLLAERGGREPEPVAAVVGQSVDAAAKRHPDARVTYAGPADGDPARTDGPVLRAVLRELIDNAVTHGRQARVSVTRRAGAVSVAVADDGPGIPERERAVLLEGEETQLRHGTGIGLWIVNWGVRELGGTIDFDERDAGGSVVTVTLPGSTSTDTTPTSPGDPS